MNYYTGCWTELTPNGDWAICWSDTTPMDRGFASKRAADKALLDYLRAGERSKPESGKFEQPFEQPLADDGKAG